MKPSMIDLIWAPAARILKSTLAVISLVMPLAMLGGPVAADFTTAMAAYERADYATAVGEFGSLAAQGDAEMWPAVNMEQRTDPQDGIMIMPGSLPAKLRGA